jgi:hypothetical protein
LGWSGDVDESGVHVVDEPADGELGGEERVGSECVDVVADGLVGVVGVDVVESVGIPSKCGDIHYGEMS